MADPHLGHGAGVAIYGGISGDGGKHVTNNHRVILFQAVLGVFQLHL